MDTVVSTMTAPLGGVMTVEEGALSGDLSLKTDWDGQTVYVFVAYAGSEDFLSVAGMPFPASKEDHLTIHEKIKAMLQKDPGDMDQDGNADASSLVQP